MHTFKISILLICSLFGFLTFSCDLEPQDRFEYVPSIPLEVTFDTITVLDWISRRGNLGLMERAIEITGLEAEYNRTNGGGDRTFMLLDNRAFTDRGEILQALSGNRGAEYIDSVDVDQLRNVLLYHIVDQYVDQGPDNLPVVNTEYIFQTLLPGGDGLMSINRDERFRLNINRAPSLPERKKGTRIREHNYVFSNGIAHLTRDYLAARRL